MDVLLPVVCVAFAIGVAMRCVSNLLNTPKEQEPKEDKHRIGPFCWLSWKRYVTAEAIFSYYHEQYNKSPDDYVRDVLFLDTVERATSVCRPLLTDQVKEYITKRIDAALAHEPEKLKYCIVLLGRQNKANIDGEKYRPSKRNLKKEP